MLRLFETKQAIVFLGVVVWHEWLSYGVASHVRNYYLLTVRAVRVIVNLKVDSLASKAVISGILKIGSTKDA